ncbi:hypothetical protein MAR_030166 [Mya arenaria]|uniref:Uncharacterized protein n=1 Tax=Mya arenaria TaxID=6604 RepID=A0ABY7DLK0_MYAAR|nr:hypothetical protein MAR_030166 [Mya arenaria]
MVEIKIDVEIEEVTIEYCLHTTGHNSDQVKEALKVVSVDPVEEIECAVGAQSKQVMAGDGFSLSSFAHHEQLGSWEKRSQN